MKNGKIPTFSDRLSVLFDVWKEGDHRDWNAIREWAMETKTGLTL